MGDKNRGLYPDGKFIVHRRDGTDDEGGKHESCSYYVLDVTHDPHAIPALRAYADSCEKDGYGLLACDLRRWANEAAPTAAPAPQPAPDAVREAAEKLRAAKRYDIEEIGTWESYRTMVQEPEGDFVEWEFVAPLLAAIDARPGVGDTTSAALEVEREAHANTRGVLASEYDVRLKSDAAWKLAREDADSERARADGFEAAAREIAGRGCRRNHYSGGRSFSCPDIASVRRRNWCDRCISAEAIGAYANAPKDAALDARPGGERGGE